MKHPVRVLIVDDVRPARAKLRRLLAETTYDLEILEADSGREALAQIVRHQPRLALLDIRMPGMDGIELARKIASLPSPPAVVFVTAYKNHALEAFKVGARDYLVKPVQQAALKRALARTLDQLPDEQQGGRHNGRQKEESVPPPRSYVLVTTKGSDSLVPLEKIIYLKADSKYVVVRTRGESYLIGEALATLEAEFGGAFIRVHRNALVSTRHIAGLEKREKRGWSVYFDTIDDRLKVSRRHKPALRRWLRKR